MEDVSGTNQLEQGFRCIWQQDIYQRLVDLSEDGVKRAHRERSAALADLPSRGSKHKWSPRVRWTSARWKTANPQLFVILVSASNVMAEMKVMAENKYYARKGRGKREEHSGVLPLVCLMSIQSRVSKSPTSRRTPRVCRDKTYGPRCKRRVPGYNHVGRGADI